MQFLNSKFLSATIVTNRPGSQRRSYTTATSFVLFYLATLITFSVYFKVRSSPVARLMGLSAGVAKSKVTSCQSFVPFFISRCTDQSVASSAGSERYRKDPGQHVMVALSCSEQKLISRHECMNYMQRLNNLCIHDYANKQ